MHSCRSPSPKTPFAIPLKNREIAEHEPYSSKVLSDFAAVAPVDGGLLFVVHPADGRAADDGAKWGDSRGFWSASGDAAGFERQGHQIPVNLHR